MIKSGLYNVTSATVRLGLSLLTIPLLIRLIGIEEYGLWTLAYTVISVVTLAEVGLSISTTVFVSRDITRRDTDGLAQTLAVVGGAMLMVATFAAIMLIVAARFIANLFPAIGALQRETLIQTLRLGAIVVWALLLQRILAGVEQAYHRFGMLNTILTVQAIATSIGMLIIAWMGGGVILLMAWHAIVNVGILIAHTGVALWLLRGLKLKLVWNPGKVRSIGQYSLLTWIASLGGTFFNQGDRLIVGALLGTSALGVYAAMTSITVQINYLSGLVAQPLLPSLGAVALNPSSISDAFYKLVKQAFQISTLVALGLGVTLFAFAPTVISIVMSSGVPSELIYAFRVVIIIYALYSVNAAGYFILFGIGALKESVTISLMSGGVALLLIAFGAKSIGLIGAILGNAGYLLVWLLTIFGMRKLNIDVMRWVKWIRFPIVWFLTSLLVMSIFQEQTRIVWIVVAMQFAILAGWFYFAQRIPLRHSMDRLE